MPLSIFECCSQSQWGYTESANTCRSPSIYGWGVVTPLHEAIDLGFDDIAHILVDAGAETGPVPNEGVSALLMATFRDNTALAVYFIERGADLNARGSEGNFPLQAAAENGNLALLKVLLAAGADATQRGSRGMHALNTAAFECHVECVRELLDYGVDPNLPDVDGTTALELMYLSSRHWDSALPEMQEGRREIIRLLTRST